MRAIRLTAFTAAAVLAGCSDDAGGSAIGAHLGAPGAQSGPQLHPTAALPPAVQCPGAQPAASEHFVERRGTYLTVAGQRFRAVGANLYYLQQLFTYAAQDGSDAVAAPALEALDAAACLDLSVVRLAAFNDKDERSAIRRGPGQFREIGLVGLDRAVAEAKRRGLRVVLILSNQHADYGGIPAYAAWEGKQPDDFFVDPAVQRHWHQHVAQLTARINTITGVRYRDEPAIVAWELANELRCTSCAGTRRLNDTVRTLARALRAYAPRHLVSDGGEGLDDDATLYPGLSDSYHTSGIQGASYSTLVDIPEIDLPSYHLYPEAWSFRNDADVDIWIDVHEALARQAGKVAYLGEYGVSPPADRDARRAAIYDRWLARVFAHQDASFAVLWQLVTPSRLAIADDGFFVTHPYDRATLGRLFAWARALQNER